MSQHHETLADAATMSAAQWLAAFDDALVRRDASAAAELFLPDGHWRDVLAFTWHMRTMNGAAPIRATLNETLASTQPRNFRLDPHRTPPRQVSRAGTETVEAMFAFETAIGRGSGVLRLVPDPRKPGRMCAWVLLTSLQEIAGHEERIGPRRPTGPSGIREFGGENWLDRRRKAAAFEDRDPVALIVGAGQAGLGLAARLGVLGIDTLIVDRHERIGDNWRNRYHSLTLHNEVFVNDLPYLPFPPNWPVYISKDSSTFGTGPSSPTAGTTPPHSAGRWNCAAPMEASARCGRGTWCSPPASAPCGIFPSSPASSRLRER
jgi:hypothetical protein